ncbi:MAG: cyclase family protein, partial [Steroidobacteraceae bacterium]|nr:cyclase family protein [Steroidobacteraceae bacterium]
RVDRFSGSVATGAGCNCRVLQLTPHGSGTHTEGVGHLSVDADDVLPVLPTLPQPAVLLRVTAQISAATAENSDYPPAPDDQLVTSAALAAAWPAQLPFAVNTAVVAVRCAAPAAVPYFTRAAADWLVRQGILHLIVELPSIDRLQDDGMLTAHRVFFGLPARCERPQPAARDAQRPQATITELAQIPAALPSGPGAVQIQAPPLSGDAIPTRPLWYPLQ